MCSSGGGPCGRRCSYYLGGMKVADLWQAEEREQHKSCAI